MAKKKTTPKRTTKPKAKTTSRTKTKSKAAATASTPRPSVTPERFTRLHRFVSMLNSGPKTRANLTKKLNLDVRGFYRDLEVLRTSGIGIELVKGKYRLSDDSGDALERLPFPDPQWTLGDAETLAKGRSAAHKNLKKLIDDITS